ncbi:MAG: hydroxymethylbilane synthase [Candidatus Omnitrophica bacterium]|nr:hydroxymethylbilane synthase [Candidatus Omnitrophota bacterium]MBU4479280.1 hydroxymethylbilane synthase [Candidatus Omnitrophota bacterium]MCG2703261.1 hydroxymethylbilane synthase [Candidatus Omnitrophota bacterium]
MKKNIVIGSRKSPLARAQARFVAAGLRKIFPECAVVIRGIVTSGDRLKKWPRAAGKGLFVKEIEEALLQGKIDIAVHSMKDVPVEIPAHLEIAAVMKRLCPLDVLVCRQKGTLATLGKGSCIGTSSPRRKAQLLAYRPDIKVAEIRGNLDTRLRKLKEGRYDAIVVAAAGMLRMGRQRHIREHIPQTIMLPAPGQGALGIEVRRDALCIKKMVKRLNHRRSFREITAEREFLRAMGGGCRTPIGAIGKIDKERLILEGFVAVEKKGRVIKARVWGQKHLPEHIGRKLAKKITLLLKKSEQCQKL